MGQRYKLEYSQEFDFLLLGIVSYERDYRITWEINSKLGMDFTRVDDHVVKHKKSGVMQHFSCFVFVNEDSYLHYKLLCNRSDMGYLIEELKNMDYLLVVTGEDFDDLAGELRDRFSALSSVQNCFILDPEKIKSSEIVL